MTQPESAQGVPSSSGLSSSSAESSRQDAVDRLGTIDDTASERLQRIVEMANRYFRMGSTSVSLLDGDLQRVIASSAGLPRIGARDESICATTIRTDGVTVLPDVATDPRFDFAPCDPSGRPLRFYAGCPISSPDGQRVGVLCVVDWQPQEFNAASEQMLRSFALLAQDILWSLTELRSTSPAEVAFRRQRSLESTPDAHVSEPIVEENPDELLQTLKETLHKSQIGVFIFDHDMRLLWANERARDLFPDSTSVRTGRSLWELDPGAKDDDFGKSCAYALENQVQTSVRSFHPRLLGWYEASMYPISHGLAVYFYDVTAEHVARTKLDDTLKSLREISRSALRRAALLDVAGAAIYVRELDHTISYWNKGAEQIYGWTAEEIVGKSSRDYLYEDPARFDEHQETLVQEGAWAGEIDQITREGRKIIADARWQIAHNNDDESSFILCVVSDVTELRLQQEIQYRAQRMESLGTLAGGMAHDLNNVLAPILISSQFLAAEESDPERRQVLSAIEISAKRGADMIRNVLSFARGEDGRRQQVDPYHLIQQVVAFCAETLPKNIDVRHSLPAGLWAVTCDETQILQVLMNLATNARDSMPNGGTLTISAKNHLADTDGPGKGSPALLISVEDTGSGMSAATATRIFEPFFTTKSVGNGTGLGLSTSLAIARKHGGDLEVYTELTIGTRFRLRLPTNANASALTVPDAHITDKNPQGIGQRVLIVDDETTIRDVVERTLNTNGYQTQTAANGAEAITIIDAPNSNIDVVFTDMMMPIAGGAVIAAHLQTHHPHIPIIAASGLAASAESATALGQGFRRFLPKPFNSYELLSALHSVLMEPRSSATLV